MSVISRYDGTVLLFLNYPIYYWLVVHLLFCIIVAFSLYSNRVFIFRPLMSAACHLMTGNFNFIYHEYCCYGT